MALRCRPMCDCFAHVIQTKRLAHNNQKKMVTCAVFVYYHISNYKNTKIWRIISIDFIFGFNGLTSGRLEIVQLRIICFVSVVLKCLLQRAFSVAATMRTTHAYRSIIQAIREASRASNTKAPYAHTHTHQHAVNERKFARTQRLQTQYE